jgi:hypothetical protein
MGHTLTRDRAITEERTAQREASATADKALELRNKLTAAIKAGHGYVPYVGSRTVAGRTFDDIKQQHIAETVLLDAMDYDDCGALLMKALAGSDCELVKALRERIVERIVEARASDLAEFAS